MKKFIFLDIDGVIVTDFDDYDMEKRRHKFNSRIVQILNYIIKETQASIVISSCWRYGRTVEQLQDIFEEEGFLYYKNIISKTPRIDIECRDKELTQGIDPPRGVEIEYWLKNFTEWNDQYRYVIIDDDGDMLLWHQQNFFKTKTDIGLTNDQAYDIIKLLNS